MARMKFINCGGISKIYIGKIDTVDNIYSV